MRRILGMFVLHVLAALLLAAVALFGFYGRENGWALFFGKADLGRVDFATFARSRWPNDALVCPPGFCRAEADLNAPVFAVPADALKSRLRAVLAADPLVQRVADYPEAWEERYVARTALMRFPDTVRVVYLPLGRDQSTLALYSSSQIGSADLGANLKRLRGWLDRLRQDLPAAPPSEATPPPRLSRSAASCRGSCRSAPG